MAISDLYTSGQHKRDLGHFANVVKLATFDNEITDNEQEIIDRLKKKLQINNTEYKSVLKNPSNFPINPPANIEARLQRLYTLISVLLADAEVKEKGKFLLKKMAIGLGFSQYKLDVLIAKGIRLVSHNFDVDSFSLELKNI